MTDTHDDALVEEIKSWLRDTFYDGVSNDRYSADHNQPDYEEGAQEVIAMARAALTAGAGASAAKQKDADNGIH